jgi:hypothetical protein
VAVDPPEAERLVTDIELFEARKARPYDDVTFLEVLRRAGPLRQDRAQAIASVSAELLEPFVRSGQVSLLRLELGVFVHSSPFSATRPSGRTIDHMSRVERPLPRTPVARGGQVPSLRARQ